MVAFVVDANVTLDWLFDEDEASAAIGTVLHAARLVAPTLWRLEVTNVILKRERRRLLEPARAVELLELLDDIAVDLVSDPPARTPARLAAIARPHRLSAYDAAYLDLAMRLSLSLFTRDQNLRDAATRVGVPLVEIPLEP